MRSVPPVSGLLLTGGRSSRMGRDKAALSVRGKSLAAHVASELAAVAYPVLVVGPHDDLGLPVVLDPGEGPLVAMAAGWRRLCMEGAEGPVVVAACDLPFVTSRLFASAAESLGESGVACPVWLGRDQPLAGCYAPWALARAQTLVDGGVRALRALLAQISVARIAEEEWRKAAPPWSLMDVDTAADLAEARRIAVPGGS